MRGEEGHLCCTLRDIEFIVNSNVMRMSSGDVG